MSFDRQRVKDLIGLGFVERREDVLLLGPVGVGKTFMAAALGHGACRAGYDVLFLRADQMLRQLNQARADHSNERFLRRLLSPDVLVIDDFGLRRLDSQQSSDFYDVVVERHRRASTIVTSNRTLEEWIGLFDDPILAQSALDRLAHNAHQIVIEGPSLRAARAPGAAKGGRRSTKTGPDGAWTRYASARQRGSTEPIHGPRSAAVVAPHPSSPRKGLARSARGCRKQRTTAGPQGGGILLRIPWGKGFEK